jgi:phosphatidylserine synthase
MAPAFLIAEAQAEQMGRLAATSNSIIILSGVIDDANFCMSTTSNRNLVGL